MFALGNGNAKRRAVEVGHRNGLIAQIVSGLEAGETVIIHPSDKIKDGTRVRKR
ncbi:MAG: hypothetical protein WBX49_05730 [Candidatus Deferrimicrobiaceae bacterium]